MSASLLGMRLRLSFLCLLVLAVLLTTGATQARPAVIDSNGQAITLFSGLKPGAFTRRSGNLRTLEMRKCGPGRSSGDDPLIRRTTCMDVTCFGDQLTPVGIPACSGCMGGYNCPGAGCAG